MTISPILKYTLYSTSCSVAFVPLVLAFCFIDFVIRLQIRARFIPFVIKTTSNTFRANRDNCKIASPPLHERRDKLNKLSVSALEWKKAPPFRRTITTKRLNLAALVNIFPMPVESWSSLCKYCLARKAVYFEAARYSECSSMKRSCGDDHVCSSNLTEKRILSLSSLGRQCDDFGCCCNRKLRTDETKFRIDFTASSVSFDWWTQIDIE